jgi:hypothetical protein
MLKFLHVERQMHRLWEVETSIFPIFVLNVPKRIYPVISETLYCEIILSHSISYIKRSPKFLEKHSDP